MTERLCKHPLCRAALSPDQHPRAQYCNIRCQRNAAAWRARERARRLAVGDTPADNNLPVVPAVDLEQEALASQARADFLAEQHLQNTLAQGPILPPTGMSDLLAELDNDTNGESDGE